MRHFFRSFLFLAVLAGAMTSCDPNDDAPLDVSPEAKMMSFGFYAADNAGVLFQDCAVLDTATSTWTVYVPKLVDKTKLVARFVVTLGDSVTVDGVGQLSGVTANDYSNPVDFYVTDGANNVRYTVVVAAAADYTWSESVSFTADSVMSFMMKVNPVDGYPYITYKQKRDVTTDQKAAMVRLVNGEWGYVGTSAGLSLGRIGSYYDFTFDQNGAPYVGYADYLATTAQTASVRSFNGTEWTNVGAQGITTTVISYTGMSFAPDNKLFLFAMNNVAGALAKRELNVSIFDGSTWTTNTTITGRASTQYSFWPTAKQVNGVLYLAVFNAVTASSFSVYSYSNGVWTTIVDNMMHANATSCNLRDFDMDVDLNGNIYIAVSDNATGAIYKPRVMKYTAATKLWSDVGDVINVNIEDTRQFDLAVSPYGVPFLLYRNSNQYPTVVSLDTETQQWTDAQVLDPVVANDLSMDFTPNGEAFASFSTSNSRVRSFKYAAVTAK
jgi:hypothetical protein